MGRVTDPPGVVALGSDFKALAAVRGLARLGVPAVLVDCVPRAAWFSRYVRARYRWRGPFCAEDFPRFLLGLAGSEGLAGWILLPMQDDAVEAVSRHAARLGEAYRLVTPDWSELEVVHDKRRLHVLAQNAGIDYPGTWSPPHERELGAAHLRYPVIVKPAVSIQMQRRIGCKALMARDARELADRYRVAASCVDPRTLMVQELIPGRGEAQFSVACLCFEGDLVAAMTARRSRQYPADFGLSSSFVEAVEVPGLIELTRRLMRRTRISGMVEVEFKRDPRDGRFKLLDVNVRPWAWHGLCRACGLDFVAMQYRLAMGEVTPAPAPRYGPRWIRIVTDLAAGVQELRSGGLTAGSYLRSLRGPLVFSVLDPRDPLPMAGDILVTAGRLAARRLRRRPRRLRQ